MDIILKYFTDFSSQQLEQFRRLEPLYKEWNEKINVISRKDIGSLYEKHVLHSLSIAAVIDFPDNSEIIDLGTGGGFPGIPLAIFFPQAKFHLVDSIAKKLKVVEAVAEGIGLKNITTQHSRIEDINNRPQDPVGKFDYVVSRAVAPLKDLWQWSKPLLKSRKSGVRSQESGVRSRELKPQSSESLPTPDSRLITNPGLFCLKGGDFTAEIQESGTRPRVVEIENLFAEEYFKEKFLLYIPR